MTSLDTWVSRNTLLAATFMMAVWLVIAWLVLRKPGQKQVSRA